jgi:hypothetical protein
MGQGGTLYVMYSPGVWQEKQISAEIQPSLHRLEGSVRHSLILGPHGRQGVFPSQELP